MAHHPSTLRRFLQLTVAGAMTAALLPTLQVATAPAASAATSGAITLHVQSARSVAPGAGYVHKGDAVTSYKWIINEDDTGNPGTLANQGTSACLPSGATYNADSCQWPSTRTTSGLAPIVAQGDESDLNDGKQLKSLPAGKYLISVTADDYKIDGAHFTVNGGAQRVTVAMQPLPLPLSTLRISVFNDNAPVDATYEVDAEPGLANFVGHLTDVFGPVSVDYYGNALCTKYMHTNGSQTFTEAQRPNLPVKFADGKPVIDPASIGRCVSDRTGLITIPNLGPNRYGATVTPPVPGAGQTYQWVQTTTLEGGHDHDIWEQEGSTGYDTEQTKGAELVPAVQFGFVRTQNLRTSSTVTGEIKGTVVAELPYIGGANGQQTSEGTAGAKFGGPIRSPWVALSDLGAGDQQIYVGRGGIDGTFDIKHVRNGAYSLTMWDDDQDYIIYSVNVTVENGEVVDVGNEPLVGWFTHIHGKVFVDSNGNGKMDAGEHGVPQFALTVRERDNSTIDQASNTASTDDSGTYDIRETYPLGKWLVLEAFNTRYRTTGITYKGENELKATTKIGAAVDLDFLPIIGLGGEVDWGVEPYTPKTNGGIVGTVSYDTTRNELDPADAVSESYQPGIPDVPVHLYAPVACKVTEPALVANECRQGKEIVPLQIADPNAPTPSVAPSATVVPVPSVLPSTAVLPSASAAPSIAPSAAPTTPAVVTMVKNPNPERGAFVKGPELADAYTSETWAAPRGCTARQYDGTILTDQQALPPFGTAANKLCVEAPMMGVAIGPSDDTPGNFGQTVNGNYGFGSSKLNLFKPGDSRNPAPNHDLALYANLADAGYDDEDLPAMDYIVSVEIPSDPVDGKPMYKVTSEEDVNIFRGDSYLPQQNFPPTLAQAGDPADPPMPLPTEPSQPPSQQAGSISPCAGALHTVHITDPTFVAGGGSPFEGYDRPSCGDKLVTVRAGQATAPNFNLFTEVPIPTHFWGLTLNDLGLTLDKRSVNYGEAQGLPFVPVGLYDWTGRLVDTTHTDFNGLYEALEPSTDTYNCPVPAGPCPNMYRFVGNDPGQPGALNSDYNARFRTIATNFQGWPGLYTVTDEAPTQVAATALAPNTTVANPTVCNLADSQPQLLAVNRPYVRKNTGSDNRIVTVSGYGFGAAAGVLKLGTTTVLTSSWSDKTIVFTVPSGFPSGAAALSITGSNGLISVNGITLQVLDSANSSTVGTTPNNPRLAEVGPGKQYATIQAAIQASTPTNAARYRMVVVWPNSQTSGNPQGEYTENVILHHQIKLQGVGPGGFDSADHFVAGSIIDGSGYSPDNAVGTAWIALLGSLRYNGNQAVPDSAVVTVLDDPAVDTTVPTTYTESIDGFSIVGGSQSDFAANIVDITGGTKTPYGATGALITQGGGIYVHSNVRNLHVTDNLIKGNSGSYGGAVRVGTPYVRDNRNYGLVLQHNQIRDNGGTNLAGGIGLFTGSDGYLVDGNAICGNFSAEYGGALTAFGYQVHNGDGLSNNANAGTISHNRIWFNSSYDEGGGVMLAGELPDDPSKLSEGTGPALIDANVIQTNLANDDGGGIRLLQVAGSHISRSTPGTITITNNTIANNVSAHEGGGIALDDAPFVNMVNNTVVKNLTTATAVTSNGDAAPAGLSTATNSDLLQARLRSNSSFSGSATLANTTFSKPTLLNNVFNDNRAGNFSGGWVYGIGGSLPDGSDNTVVHWDMGVPDDSSARLTPTGSVLQATDSSVTDQVTPSPTNTIADDVKFKSPYDVTVNILSFRTYPAFRQAVIVAQILPPNLMGDYHLATAAPASPARGRGAANVQVNWGIPGNNWSYLVSAPTPDIDGDARPTGTRYDAGSDQMKP